MPVLSPHLLSDHRELRLAHLALGFISMGYVWQEGQQAPAQTLPKARALPYWLVSWRLGLPPILTYADSVLANWKLRDPTGPCGSNCVSWNIEDFCVRVQVQNQSSAIQCFDALLCIQHEDEAGAFLTRMRDYMPPAHRQQIETLSVCPSLRDFIVSNSSSDLCQAYNSSVSALVDLRNYHLNTVTKYIIVPGNRARTMGCPLRGVGTELNGTGTSGSSFMVFLKSVRNDTQKALILE